MITKAAKGSFLATKKQKQGNHRELLMRKSYPLLGDVVQHDEVHSHDVGVISRLAHIGTCSPGMTSDDDDDDIGTLGSKNNVMVQEEVVLPPRVMRRTSSSSETPSSLTPSLFSVMSQVHKFNNLPTSAVTGGMFAGTSQNFTTSCRKRREASFSSTSSSTPSRGRSCGVHSVVTSYAENGRIRKLSDGCLRNWLGSCFMAEDDDLDLENENFEHPLTVISDGDEEFSSPPEGDLSFTGGIPHVKYINLEDIDLQPYWTPDAIVQYYPPVYQRQKMRNCSPKKPSKQASVGLTIDELNNVGMMLNGPQAPKAWPNSMLETVELEYWPPSDGDADLAVTDDNKLIDTDDSWKGVHLPNRRTRQLTLNPNFLRLYAMETSCKTGSLLPDLNVDENILRKFSYQDIWNLRIPNNHENVTPYQIKLALLTKRKLWTEMCNTVRQDLHGVHAPWNLKFVTHPQSSTSEDGNSGHTITSSLVRLESDVKPWSKVGNQFMLRPCGRLSMGKNSDRDIQYVVKGWCDSRFC